MRVEFPRAGCAGLSRKREDEDEDATNAKSTGTRYPRTLMMYFDAAFSLPAPIRVSILYFQCLYSVGRPVSSYSQTLLAEARRHQLRFRWNMGMDPFAECVCVCVCTNTRFRSTYTNVITPLSCACIHYARFQQRLGRLCFIVLPGHVWFNTLSDYADFACVCVCVFVLAECAKHTFCAFREHILYIFVDQFGRTLSLRIYNKTNNNQEQPHRHLTRSERWYAH